ncbi:MAG: methionine--tRNA ligase, partial [Bacteroidota bacterium]
GYEQRTIVSGIAHCYEPEKIIGQQVTIIANLAPRKIKGIESRGMILMAEDEEGKLKFVMPSEKINNGSNVK